MGIRHSLSRSSHHSLSRFLRLGSALGATSALGAGILACPAAAAEPQPSPSHTAGSQPSPPGTAEQQPDYAKQAALVDQEDQRIMQTRSVLTAILQIGGNATAQWKRPQLFGSAHGKTLVLPPSISGKAYTVADLEKYGGKYFQKQSDGSYLLGVHVFLADGAELVLSNPAGPLVIRMGSLPGAFSSIVSFGGSIKVEGTPRQPVKITSWDARLRRPDTQVSDGRAYIRAVGGDFKMKYAEVSHLGFYSGRTGGIALTGTDRPASAVKRLSKEQRHAAKQRRLQKNKEGGTTGGGGPGDLETEQPRGTATHIPAADLVTGAIDHSTISGNAFGLFVSGSNQTQITGDTIKDSLVDGLVLHRFTKNANVHGTTVTGSGGDGFVLSRATEKIRVTDCTAERNEGNGFTVNGQALADGPSASGESLERFGDSSVNNSVARDNGRYGVELLGGDKLAVQHSKIIGGAMGIVVRDGASGVQISGNQLSGQSEQGIALRDGVRDASLAGNTVVGARTGIYLRNASGTLVGNVVKGASAHGITLVGDAKGSQVRDNTLSGSGTSAVSASRAHGKVKRADNNTEGWNDTASLWTKAKRYAKPMNLIWFGVLSLVILSMLRARGNGGLRVRRVGVHPYELQRPLDERPVIALPRRVEAAARATAQAVSHRLHGPSPAHGSRPLHGSHHHLPDLLNLTGSDLVRASTRQSAPRPEGEGLE
ncbi:right-handed parallel beta-helix repeat-containing protein [Spirillospora sp. NPDC048911]|uniref:right-handed parallel beta-helix repeat-containing protein n=1 Tax=Spirillospora sp. NPDC048911 TaxID=3364527 RepID=UPI0037121711